MLIRPPYRILLAIICSLIFSALVFAIAILLGFGTDVDLFSSVKILGLSLMFLLIPSSLGILLCYKLSPKHLFIWMVVIVLPFPFGFLVGLIPKSPTTPLLAVLIWPVLLGVFLLVMHLKKAEEK